MGCWGLNARKAQSKVTCLRRSNGRASISEAHCAGWFVCATRRCLDAGGCPAAGSFILLAQNKGTKQKGTLPRRTFGLPSVFLKIRAAAPKGTPTFYPLTLHSPSGRIGQERMNLENSVATPLMLRYAQETALLSTNGVVTSLVRDRSPWVARAAGVSKGLHRSTEVSRMKDRMRNSRCALRQSSPTAPEFLGKSRRCRRGFGFCGRSPVFGCPPRWGGLGGVRLVFGPLGPPPSSKRSPDETK